MSQHAPRCPACGSTHLDDLGALPPFEPDSFGGQPTETRLAAGHFLRCPTCDLRFRSPCPTDDELTKLYENLPDTVWYSAEPRPYWPVTSRLLERYAVNNAILDVGCFCGDMLHWLPAKWAKHGIEPGLSARRAAEKRNICMLGRTADELTAGQHQFGAILSFDVIEHLTQPLIFLERLHGSLAPGGSLILFTGSTETWPYRLFGRHYWYGSFPEHVSFYSLAWFTWAADRLNMKVSDHHYLTSERRDWKLWAKQWAQISVHTLFRKLRERGVSNAWLARLPFIGRAAAWKTVPWWKQATDHIMVVLTKK